MEATTDIIGLRFDGNGIKPSAVKASEVADLIKSFEFALDGVVQVQNSDYNDNLVYLSFDEIKENCLTLKYKPHRNVVLAAYLTVITAFQTNDFNSLPRVSIDNLKTFTKFSKKYNCIGSFTKNGDVIAGFSKSTDIKYTDDGTLSGETVIYGEIKRAGGDIPRATIMINNDYSASFDVSKEIAIQLAANLYKDIGLKGRARWDRKTYKILDFKPESLIHLDPKPLKDTFLELHNLFSNHLDNLDDII